MDLHADITDTICAISSPPGVGAIALIRISGKNAFEIINCVFSKTINTSEGYKVYYGNVISNQEIIDEVIITTFANPNSFTGEDIIEIACHGSSYIQQEILKLLISKGCRMAEPGEFSKRAFYNGKMDLTQTEAIADLIHSETAGAHKLAVSQMKGGISKELRSLRDALVHFASMVELELDFAEEDIEFADRTELMELVQKVKIRINSLKDSFQTGSAIKDGVSVAIAGKPNAGKSSWINALTKDDVAIVSDIPGTTRDKIEVPIFINGQKFRLIDTAGIRATKDTIEEIGVERALQVISNAHVVLYLIEINDLNENHLNNVIDDINSRNEDAEKFILINKTDTSDHLENLMNQFSEFSNLFFCSVKSEDDIETLKTKLSEVWKNNTNADQDIIVTNVRHYEALSLASLELEKVIEGLEMQISGDLVAMDIRQVIHQIGSITGEISTDNLLGHIFANFCIGK